jgi:LysM repeat protein/ribosomal protein L40E
MSPETDIKKSKICPTCGTRLSENATRCLVCGTELTAKAAPSAKKADKPAASPLQAGRMPEITLSLPAALGALLVILLIGAIAVYFTLQSGITGTQLVEPTAVSTATETPTITPTATEISTSTPLPTATEQPPFDYTIKAGETCGGIAYTFGVSVSSIIMLNTGIDAACTNLRIGQVIKVPFPTATPLPLPTNTLEPAEATKAACPTASYTVQENDTLSSISLNYNVSMAAIREYNGLPTDAVYLGQTLLIPLCARAPTPGPSPTSPPPPPYPAPNLLLPVDGAAFTLAHDEVILQWASLGALRDGEAYQVIIEDVTADEGRRIMKYVTDTKYIITAADFRPDDTVAHIMRWWVVPVRQTGTDDQGNPIYSPAGAASEKRVFTWVGVTVQSTPAQ